jgi:hypothetical protein
MDHLLINAGPVSAGLSSSAEPGSLRGWRLMTKCCAAGSGSLSPILPTAAGFLRGDTIDRHEEDGPAAHGSAATGVRDGGNRLAASAGERRWLRVLESAAKLALPLLLTL